MTLTSISGPLQPWRIVGRAPELKAIRNALAATDQRTRIFYFVAPAGVGKTRLLREAENLIRKDFSASCEFGGFFDFTDTELHSNSRLEQRFLDNLDAAGEKFAAYRKARREFEEERRIAPIPTRLDEKRRELGKLLVEGLNQITAESKKKLVLCFDTLEALQYESDDIQKIIGHLIQEEVIEARGWLAEHLPPIKNAVILLAGRPKPLFEEYLGGAFAQVEYQRTGLGDLSPSEVEEYFAVMAETYEKQGQPDVAKHMRKMQQDTERAHLLTGGRPLMLSFVTDLLHYDWTLPVEFQPTTKLVAMTEDQKRILRQQVKEKLANAVMNDISSDIRRALPFIALARKGVDTELLELLMRDEEGWHQAKCAEVLENLSLLSYAKPRRHKDGKLVRMFLHDELYDLLDEKEIQPHIEHYAAKCQPIIAYYDAKIQKAIAAGNRSEEFRLKAEQLWYRFVQNPREGYHEYSKIFDRAIINRQIGLDMLVRDEMLRFFRPDVPLVDNANLRRAQNKDPNLNADRINRGAGIRWVQRLIANGRFPQAIEAAQKLKESSLKSPEDPLFVPILDMWEGEARAYLEVGVAEQVLDRAIAGFDEAESRLTPESEYLRTLHSRNKGRAYNTRGYARARQHRYAQAAEDYRIALPLLRETGLPHQTAGTITNLAFAWVHTGQYLAAEALCREALRICEENDLDYLKGLTLNTLALVDLEAERPHRAVALAQQAMEIFAGLREGGERRGIGLANLALGEAYRRIAKLGIYPETRTWQFLDDSKRALQTALETFRSDGASPEKPRELEAYQELGCLYRQWARFLRGLAKEEQSLIAELEDNALASFQAASPLTEEIVGARADLLNDLAELYANQEQYDTALATLTESDYAIAKIDPSYLLINGRGQPREPVASLYVVLGKNSLLRGRLALRQKSYDDAAKYYTFASAYFDRFEGDLSAQEIAARRVYRIYHDLVDAGLRLDELRKFRHRVEDIEEQVLYQRPGFRRPTTLSRNFNDVLVVVSPIL